MVVSVPKAVFLDRDGVLNEPIVRDGRPYPPVSIGDLVIYPDAEQALCRLKMAGFALIVVTNQPDVARGTQTRHTVDELNSHLAQRLPIDDIRVCFHDDSDDCLCRKPKPGLLTAPPLHDLKRSFLIGDRWRDVEAGITAGCRTVLIDRGYSEKQPAAHVRVSSLSEAVDWILHQREVQ